MILQTYEQYSHRNAELIAQLNAAKGNVSLENKIIKRLTKLDRAEHERRRTEKQTKEQTMKEQLNKNIPELLIERYLGPNTFYALNDYSMTRMTGRSWDSDDDKAHEVKGDPGHVIQVFVYDENDQPVVGARVFHSWPQNECGEDSPEVRLTEMKDSGGGVMQPCAEIFMGGEGASNLDADGYGPHNIWIADDHAVIISDKIWGCAMPMNRHTVYTLTFKRIKREFPVEPPVTPPTSDLKTQIYNALSALDSELNETQAEIDLIRVHVEQLKQLAAQL